MKLQLIKNQLIRRGPSHLILHVTNRCNLNCQTCFVDTNTIPREREISPAEIRNLTAAFNDLIFVDIGGGEPFLREDLADICALLKTRYLSIPTNGFNPEKILATVRRIREKVTALLTISVSLDGFEKTNDGIRGRGSFEKALRTIKLLRRVPGINLKVNTVLSNYNYHEIIGFMEYVRNLDPDFHSLIFLRGKPRVETFNRPSIRELRAVREKILAIWKTYSYGLGALDSMLLRHYHKSIYEASLRVMEEERQIPTCLAFKHHLVVYPDGEASFCEMLPTFGNVLQKPLPLLMKEDKARQQAESIKNGDCCCYHNCNLMDNFFLNIFQYPRLIFGR